ncbi:MAG TPA: MFS transporter [Coriobacteriia bacterium]
MSGGSVLQPLRRRDFRRLWIAQTISIVGDKINQVGLIIMVGRLTGSIAQMGIVLAITFLPAALFGLIAGPLVDRWDRRRTMVTADLLRAALVAGIAVVAVVHAPSWLVIALAYVLAFASSTVSLFFEPSRMALVPSILTEDELLAANALDSTTQSVSELLGIGFGGALVATIGYGSAFWIDAATFLVSAAFVATVSHRAIERVLPKLRVSVVWDDLKYGLERIRRDGVLRGVTITYSAIALGAGAVMTLTLLLALNVYTTVGLSDALRLTIEEIATTAGLLVGSMAIGMASITGSGRKYLRGIVTLGLLLMVFLVVPNIWVASLVFFAVGWANVYLNVPMVTLLQIHTEEETRGRVFAVRSTLTRVAAVVGLVGGGVAAQVYGVVPMVVALGVFFAAIGGLGFAMPRLRNA